MTETAFPSPTRRAPAGPVGVGLGLRWEFIDEVEEGAQLHDIAFFEISPENYMRRGGYYPAALEKISQHYPMVCHGLTMSLGAIDRPDDRYLADLRSQLRRVASPWHSDHLCFSSSGSRILHELLPLKLCDANVQRVADRIRFVQDRLGVPMAVENISWYAHPGRREMPETEFINQVVERADCGLLLDVNNVYVNAQNHGFDPYDFMAQMPFERVFQIHVAGHTRKPSGLVIDTHGRPVCDPVMALLAHVIERTGPVAVLLERDNDIPRLDELLEEVRQLRGFYEQGLAGWRARRHDVSVPDEPPHARPSSDSQPDDALSRLVPDHAPGT